MATARHGEYYLTSSPVGTQKAKLLFWWIGSICLLLIIPVKAIRWVHSSWATTVVVGIAPSVLGPVGLLFLILSSSGKLSRLTLVQITLVVATIALGLEFAQLIPRPGILAQVHYTFDWLDVIASAFSVCVGYLIARLITKKKQNTHNP
jgi:glycopeptide antibiotics resistance protein